MGDSTVLPLHLGFVGESEKQPMETEGGGLTATRARESGKKRPPSPSTLPGDDDGSSKPTTDDDDGEWLVSSSEEDEDHENQGIYSPFTIDDIPRPSCDHKQQSDILFANPDVKRRGPSPIMLVPAFKSGKHVFDSDYNLRDKSEISVRKVEDCSNECRCWPMVLLQFIDIKIAGYRHAHPGRAKIFGFVAARETVDSLRNYVYNRGIKNCETVSVKRKTGVARLSLTSPARVISMPTRVLIEFELHALSESEKGGDDDLIIEGCTELNNMFARKSFIEHQRLYSEKCALDLKYAVLRSAVEARIDVEVLRVPSHGVGLKLYAKTSGFDDVIRLFQGTPSEPGFLTSFVVAVKLGSYLDLRLEGSPSDHALGQKPLPRSWWEYSFSACFHETMVEPVELGEFASFSVKITWKSYEKRSCELHL